MFQETTKPLLRQDQVKEIQSERKRIQGILNGPDHVKKAIQDKIGLQKQLRNVTRDLETQMPNPYSREELDLAVKREASLREEWLQGMLTAAEMRKCPSGAVNANMAWEKRNKNKILEWKNIRKRLAASGDLKGMDRLDSYGVSNIEAYRPVGGSQEMNLDSAQIPGKSFHMDAIPDSVVFNDQDIAKLHDLDPELAATLATLPASARAEIKKIIMEYQVPRGTIATTDVLCQAEGGCKRRPADNSVYCWQHQPVEISVTDPIPEV